MFSPESVDAEGIQFDIIPSLAAATATKQMKAFYNAACKPSDETKNDCHENLNLCLEDLRNFPPSFDAFASFGNRKCVKR